MPKMTRYLAAVIVAAMFVFPSEVFGQIESTDVSVFEFREAGRPAKTVYLFGSVAKSGIWRLDENATFVELIALAGARTLATPESAESTTLTEVKVFRGPENNRSLVFVQDLDQVLGGVVRSPVLTDGDVVFLDAKVHRKRRVSLRTVTSVIAAASSLALLIIRAGNI